MNSKITRAIISISVAAVCLWLLSSSIAQAAMPGITSRVARSPNLNSPLAIVTPTLHLVTTDTKLLGTPPVYRMTTSAASAQPLDFYLLNASTTTTTLVAESIEVVSANGQTVPARFALSPIGQQVVDANQITTFTLSVDGRLPAGQYTGTLGFSIINDVSSVTTSVTVTGTEPPITTSVTVTGSESSLLLVTEQFVLVVSDWPAELEWAQDEFVYVADQTRITDTVRVKARYADVTNGVAMLAVLVGTDKITEPFKTSDFLSITELPTLSKDQVAPFTLTFNPAKLPTPGTYNGVIEASASNAAPITAPFTLLVPDQPHGSYQLVVGELYQSPQVSTSLSLTSALQFSGMRWLPVSNNSVIPVWPIVVAALLLCAATILLVLYALWAWSGLTRWKVALIVGWVVTWVVVVVLVPCRLQLVSAVAVIAVLLCFAVVVGVVIGYVAKVSSGSKERRILLAVALIATWIVPVAGVLFLSPAKDLNVSQALVEGRTLLLWEAAGRGPIRDVTVSAGNVVNQSGDEGQITLNTMLPKSTTIPAGQISTVTVESIGGLSQAGVYQGRVLIQSPDLEAGVVEVPIQVTVHDAILWPALVILLGVLIGGWVKYLSDTTGEKLQQRKSLEEAWGKWNEYLAADPVAGPCGTANSFNPIYTRVRARIDAVEQQLNSEPEWGIEDAKLTVTSVSTDLTSYQTLGANLTSLKKAFSHLDQSAAQTGFQQTKAQLSNSTDAINNLLNPEEPKPQPGLPQAIIDQLKQTQDAIKTVPDTLALDPREHVNVFERELCSGELGEAQQHWQDNFVAELPFSLATLRQQMNDWEMENKEMRTARLKPANSLLVSVDQYLKNTPVPHAAAWRSLIEAKMAFEAERAKDIAAVAVLLVQTAKVALEGRGGNSQEISPSWVHLKGTADVPMSSDSLQACVEESLVSRMFMMSIEPQIIVNSSMPYTWGDIETENVTCKIDLQFRGFDAVTNITVEPVGSAQRLSQEISGKPLHTLGTKMSDDKNNWDCTLALSFVSAGWEGDPQTYEIVAKPPEKMTVRKSITIRSPYTIELPLHRLAAGENFIYQAAYKDPAKPADHHGFEWKFGDDPKPIQTGNLSEDKPGGRHRIPSDHDTSKPAEIQFLVYSTPTADPTCLVQKSRRSGLVQESAIKALYRDKRRANFSRRMAALLIALVGGLLAQRAFGLTFGSFEEYLGAFAWGVAVSAGIDPIADGFNNVKKAIQDLTDKWTEPKPAPPNPAGQ